MNANLNTKPSSRTPKVNNRNALLPVLIVGLALLIAACGPGNLRTPTPESSFPTITPSAYASIEGMVWHDTCLNLGLDESPPAGCIPNAELGRFVGDGIIEPGEVGLAEVEVKLGLGACPSAGFAEVRTNTEGRYSFQGLAPGEYCVSARIGELHLPSVVEPGVWTSPSDGMTALSIPEGGTRTEVNFGWDYLNIPSLPTPIPTAAPSAEPSCSAAAEFVKDVTVADGARLGPRESFEKTWRLRNDGSCTWSAEYDLVFLSGYRLGGDGIVPLPGAVEPGETVDLTVEMAAPRAVGTYTGYWMLRNPEGELFGVGDEGDGPIWVRILVEPEIDDWRGEYFDNRDLEGDPILIRDDEEIDFNWKDDSPVSGISDDNFSARWTRELKFKEGTYRFAVRVDDGVRLWLDDRLVIDEWERGSARTLSVDLRMAKGKHDIKLEYFERKGTARVRFEVTEVDIEIADGWLGTYWFNRDFDSEWGLVRVDSAIDFDWGSKAPGLGIPKDNFSARWSRSMTFEPGIYRLYALANGRVRVVVDGNTLIDERNRTTGGDAFTADLELSGHSDLQIDYVERHGNAKIAFWWEFMRPLNQAPLASADSYEMAQEGVLVVDAPGVLENDEDPDGDSMIAALSRPTGHGDIALNQDGSLIYTPDPGFSGEDSFDYRVSDGALSSDLAQVTITVKPLNAAPTAEDDEYSGLEDELLIVQAPGILANDIDPEGQDLMISLQDEPTHGTLTLAEDGGFEYAPDPDFFGEDQFSYQVSDGHSDSGLAVVRMAIAPVNDTPQAIDDEAVGIVDQALDIDVLANDLGRGDGPITITIVAEPSQGGIEIIEQVIRYVPTEGFAGEDGFEYAITDLDGEISQATVVIMMAAAEN